MSETKDFFPPPTLIDIEVKSIDMKLEIVMPSLFQRVFRRRKPQMRTLIEVIGKYDGLKPDTVIMSPAYDDVWVVVSVDKDGKVVLRNPDASINQYFFSSTDNIILRRGFAEGETIPGKG